MRPRTVGKIVMAVLTVLFVTLAFIYALNTDKNEDLYHGFRAVCAAILALTAATCYRYFED